MIIKIIGLCLIPSILIMVSDLMVRMDNGEKFWWNKITDKLQIKYEIYCEKNINKNTKE